jgi:ABC-type lipoprotein export system ATPase subunit
MNDERGSKWLKWDLHVHTPYSLVNTHFEEKDGDDIWETYIKDLENLPDAIQVLGINDYLFIDGYKKILEYKKQGRLPKIKLILPVIELRIAKFGGRKEFKRINLHIIFSNELSPEIIEQQFLNALSARYILTPDQKTSWGGAAITRESLSDFGKRIIESSPDNERVNYSTPIIEGFNNLNIDDVALLKYLEENTYLKDHYLLAIGKTEWDAFNWNDNSIAEKKTLINKCDLVFTSSESIENFKNAKQSLKANAVKDLLLDCSDAHSNSWSKQKDRIGKCFTWIKSDPSFEGLRQITHEPDRVYVGELPPLLRRMYSNPTKFIKRIKINKKRDSELSESWFDGLDIKLNAGLVAIIGNKGNGKSALADIISLCGNTKNHRDLSFLTADKFKKKPENKAKQFEASIIWRNDHEDTKNLDDLIDESLFEKVKYLPQNFVEKLCTKEDGSDFEHELRKIIFSHTDTNNRLTSTSLEELIKNKTEIVEKEIRNTINDIIEINTNITELEKQKEANVINALKNALENKLKELTAHDANKPKEVLPPQITKELAHIQEQINLKSTSISSIDVEIKTHEQELSNALILLNELDKLTQSLDLIKHSVRNFKKENSNRADQLGIDIEKLIQFQTNEDAIIQKRKNIGDIIYSKNDLINEGRENNLKSQREKIKNDLAQLQNQLDQPAKNYYFYQSQLKEWNENRDKIIGSKEIEGSIAYYESKIRYINEALPKEYNDAIKKRQNLVSSLYDIKSKIITIYRDLYKPVIDFIDKYKELLNDYKINVDVTFQLDGFIEKFFTHINLGAKGTFIGKEDGIKKLRELIEDQNLNDKEGFISLLRNIVKNLLKDHRPDQSNAPRSLADQLKKSYTPTDFYNFLFSLEYLKPVFKLKLGTKDLSELSPGERGALLLIFYLLIDNDDIPLVIDQPEENLDNQSVYTMLVHFIKYVKHRRQIIIVTHNPNLAVVCDAEQIIYTKIEKDKGNKMECLTGAIENPVINEKIVEILEGTFPAFDNRTAKYKVTKR